MKPQARPFTVEVKSKRRPLLAPQTNWSTVIDEPSPDDLPTREVPDDGPDTPFAAASRVFSAFATNAISSASTLGDLASSVFTPKSQEQPAEQPASEEGRSGRILPSLLPLSPFDTASVQDDKPHRKAAKANRPRKRPATVPSEREAPEPTEGSAVPAVHPATTAELSVAAAPPPQHGRKPNRRRAEARVRAGEGWKRRRLPKACW
jgi:hypothetical protein